MTTLPVPPVACGLRFRIQGCRLSAPGVEAVGEIDKDPFAGRVSRKAANFEISPRRQQTDMLKGQIAQIRGKPKVTGTSSTLASSKTQPPPAGAISPLFRRRHQAERHRGAVGRKKRSMAATGPIGQPCSPVHISLCPYSDKPRGVRPGLPPIKGHMAHRLPSTPTDRRSGIRLTDLPAALGRPPTDARRSESSFIAVQAEHGIQSIVTTVPPANMRPTNAGFSSPRSPRWRNNAYTSMRRVLTPGFEIGSMSRKPSERHRNDKDRI